MADAKKQLADSLKKIGCTKTMEKTSINDILEDSGVSRQTFYKYFPDKYALAFYIYKEDIAQKSVVGFYQSKDFDDMNRNLLKSLKENSAFYRNMFMNAHIQNSFSQQFHEFCVQQTAQMVGVMNMTNDIQQLIDFWSVGTEALISRFCINGCVDDIEWMVKMFRRLMPEELKPFLLK